jgi:hypothetical protein
MYLICEPRPRVSEHYQVNRVFELYYAIGETAFDGWKTLTKAKDAIRSISVRDCMHEGRNDYSLTLTPSRRLLRDILTTLCSPKFIRNSQWFNLFIPPPFEFIATHMQFMMMSSAKRDSELI